MKPPLILKEKDLRAGIDNQNYEFRLNLKKDLISVFQCLRDNEKTLKINLIDYEYETECGTYRCVCGWWAHWLDIPIKTAGGNLTARFKKIFLNSDLWKGFVKKSSDNWVMPSYGNIFFGSTSSGTLPKKLARAQSLQIKKKFSRLGIST